MSKSIFIVSTSGAERSAGAAAFLAPGEIAITISSEGEITGRKPDGTTISVGGTSSPGSGMTETDKLFWM